MVYNIENLVKKHLETERGLLPIYFNTKIEEIKVNNIKVFIVILYANKQEIESIKLKLAMLFGEDISSSFIKSLERLESYFIEASKKSIKESIKRISHHTIKSLALELNNKLIFIILSPILYLTTIGHLKIEEVLKNNYTVLGNYFVGSFSEYYYGIIEIYPTITIPRDLQYLFDLNKRIDSNIIEFMSNKHLKKEFEMYIKNSIKTIHNNIEKSEKQIEQLIHTILHEISHFLSEYFKKEAMLMYNNPLCLMFEEGMAEFLATYSKFHGDTKSVEIFLKKGRDKFLRMKSYIIKILSGDYELKKKKSDEILKLIIYYLGPYIVYKIILYENKPIDTFLKYTCDDVKKLIEKYRNKIPELELSLRIIKNLGI